MPLISVIVPVYNSENYLHRCIDSILTQTFEDLELILVDDGSIDGSSAICDEYAGQDSRVRVIHQQNNGVSCARNAGVEASSGRFAVFVDADDMLCDCAVERLFFQAQKHPRGLIVGGFSRELVDQKHNQKTYSRQLSRQYLCIRLRDDLSKLEDLWTENNMLSACCKMYNLEIIKNQHIWFNPKMVVLEDFDFVISYLKQCDCVVSIENVVYICYHSASDHSYLHRARADYVDDVVSAYKSLEEYLDEINIAGRAAFVNGVLSNFGPAIESLWAQEVDGLKAKIQKYRHISKTMRRPEVQLYTKSNRWRYSCLEYWARLGGHLIILRIHDILKGIL